MKKCLFALVFSFGVLFQLSSQAPTVVIKQFICNSDDTYNLVIEVYGAGDISTFGGYQVDAGSYEVSSCYDSSLDTGLPCIITYPIPAPPPVCGCNGEEFSNEGCAINAGYPSWTEGPCTGSERVEFTIHNLPSTENTTINVFRLVKVDGEEFVGPSISIQANHTCSQASCLTCHPKTNPIVFTITQDTAVTIEHLMKETKQGCNLSFDRTQKIKEIPFVCSMLRIQPTLDSFWVYDLVKGDSCLSFVHFVNDGYCCTPYTTCDDKNPCTYGDYFDNNCNCIGKLNTSNKEYSFTTTNGEKIVMDKFADSCSVYVFIFYFHWCKPCQDLYKSHLPSDYDIHPNLKVIPIMMEATEANIDSLKNYGYNFIDNNPFKNIVDGGETEYLADHCLNTVPTVFVKCPSNDTLSVITPYGNKQSIPDAINNIIHNNCKCAPSNEVTISIPSKSVNYLDTFSIPVTVSGFKDILSFQFPVTYDTTKLEYLKIHSFSKKLNNFTNSSVGIPNKGKITCVYFEPNLTAFSLSNPDTLFSIQFKTLSNNCDSSMVSVPNSVQINNKPFEIEISDNFKPLLYKTTDSQIKLNQTLCNNCTHPDYAPLMALYNSTNGKDWTNNTGWKEGAEGSSCDPCNFYGKAWYGVQCENGRLTHVDLSNNKLKGELPKEFCELIYLHSLSLRSNELIGKIPNDVNRLEKLRFLDIGNNQLSGELPNEIGELENLAVIQLDENTLTGSIPKGIGRLTKLINLTISENRLSGEIPNEIGELGNLSIIQLNKNTLTGSIPKEIGRLTKLETLSLADNELSGEIPKEIGGLVNLSGLYLSQNQISGVIPSEIGELVNLDDLSLGNNQISGEIPSEINDLIKLKRILLFSNKLNGNLPDLNKLIELKALDCSYNQLIGAIPNLNLPNLVLFHFENNKIDSIPMLFLPSLKPDTSFQRGLRTFINHLTFDDILPNIQYATSATFIYAPQDSIYRDTTFTRKEGENLTIDLGIDAAITTNVYKWYKDGTLVDSIVGSNKRTFNSIKQSDAGLWTCRVTNPVAPLLTLQSRKITIQLECLTTTSINDIQICQGESIIIGNSTYILPGTYIDTLQSSIGCDSIITTIITQKPNSSFSQNIQLCEGESITIGSNTYNKDGFYVDTLVAMNGCDSFVNTFLTIFPVSFVEYAITICHGSSIAVGNKVYNQSGNYLDTLQGIHGCDSIIQTILTIRPEISFTINGPDKLCKGDQAIISTTMQGTYLWSNGQTTSSITETLETNTTYTLMLTDDFGCSASTAKSVIVVAPKIKGIPVNDTVVFCMKDTLIDPFSLLTQYDSNGTWLWNGSEISGQSFNLNAIPSGTHSLVYGFYNQLPCPDSDTSLVINVKDCRIEDCAFMVTDDSIRVNKNQVAEILLTANDILPDTFIISIISTDPDVLDDVSLDETGLFKFLPSNKFSDAAIVAYEVCTPDCSECKQAKLYITNEALKDIILTNIILPNSSGNNATLRFTKDEILEDSELYIFNRNGDKIFQMKDYDNSWNADGYPGGIYFYVLMYRGVDIKKTLTIMK